MIHHFQKRTLDFVRRHQLMLPQEPVLVAVSGGPDSVALLHALHAIQELLGISGITVAHFNHQLRGDESIEDMLFVQSLAERFDLAFISRSEDVLGYRAKHGGSIEMAARILRHRFLAEAAKKCRAGKIALGHTAEDQAEELFLRLLRGTGPSGMTGMRPITTKGVIRPILFAIRQEVLAYLDDMRLSYRTDRSNLEPTCQRNVLRLQVFPILRKRFQPHLTKTVCRFAQLMQEEESFWAEQLEDAWRRTCLEEKESRIVLQKDLVNRLHPALRRRLLRRAMGVLQGELLGFFYVHLETLMRWLMEPHPEKPLRLPNKIWAVKEGDFVIFTKQMPSEPNAYRCTICSLGEHEVFTRRFTMREKVLRSLPSEKELQHSPLTAWMDADKITWPLVIRSWQPGDRFKPIGFHGTKKLHDFFIDCKIPRSQRMQIPILCDQEKICWICGHRLDDRVKVTGRTKKVLVVEVRDIASGN